MEVVAVVDIADAEQTVEVESNCKMDCREIVVRVEVRYCLLKQTSKIRGLEVLAHGRWTKPIGVELIEPFIR